LIPQRFCPVESKGSASRTPRVSFRVRREGFEGQTVVVGWHDIVVEEEAREFDDVGVAGMLTRRGRNSRSDPASRGIGKV